MVSGCAAAAFLVIPGFVIAIFSVGKRQAEMFMTSAVDKIGMAFRRATHVRKEQYNELKKTQETMIYVHPTGEKQILGCYPGSVKVCRVYSNPPFLVLFNCGSIRLEFICYIYVSKISCY